jgi:hypothetical protein
MKRFFILLAVVALFGAMTLPSYVQADKPASDAQVQNRPDAAPDEYFVAFRDSLTENDKANVRATGARINGEFPEVRAVAVKVRNEQQRAALQRNPRVEYVEAVPMRYKMGLSTTQLTPTQQAPFSIWAIQLLQAIPLLVVWVQKFLTAEQSHRQAAIWSAIRWAILLIPELMLLPIIQQTFEM